MSSEVKAVSRPSDVGNVPARPIPANAIPATMPSRHTTLAQFDVLEAEHIFPDTGEPPIQSHEFRAEILLVPKAAASSHMIVPSNSRSEGAALGVVVGVIERSEDGINEGADAGISVGSRDGLEGIKDGFIVGTAVGVVLGNSVGPILGDTDGLDGKEVGCTEGNKVGVFDGDTLGIELGDTVGSTVGGTEGLDG